MIAKNLMLVSLLAFSGCGVASFEGSDFDWSIMRSKGQDKVELCHVPPGNPANAHTIVVGEPALSHHLANHPGDHVGKCSCEEDRVGCDDTDLEDTASEDTDLEDTASEDTASEDTDSENTDLEDTASEDTDSEVAGREPLGPRPYPGDPLGLRPYPTDSEDTDSEDTGGDCDADTDTNTDTDTNGGTGDTGNTDDGRVWVQNGCNTAPASFGLFCLILPIIFRRRSA